MTNFAATAQRFTAPLYYDARMVSVGRLLLFACPLVVLAQCSSGAVQVGGDGGVDSGADATGKDSSANDATNADVVSKDVGSDGTGCTECNGSCTDLLIDPKNCGYCGGNCGGNSCIGGTCSTSTCVADGDPCTADGDCCSLFCASDGNCGCILTGDTTSFCSADSDCCSDNCDLMTGVCM